MLEEKRAVRLWGVEIFRCWRRCDGVVVVVLVVLVVELGRNAGAS